MASPASPYHGWVHANGATPSSPSPSLGSPQPLYPGILYTASGNPNSLPPGMPSSPQPSLSFEDQQHLRVAHGFSLESFDEPAPVPPHAQMYPSPTFSPHYHPPAVPTPPPGHFQLSPPLHAIPSGSAPAYVPAIGGYAFDPSARSLRGGSPSHYDAAYGAAYPHGAYGAEAEPYFAAPGPHPPYRPPDAYAQPYVRARAKKGWGGRSGL